MLETWLKFRRACGEDRFYVPVKARKNQNQKLNQQQQQQKANGKIDENDTQQSKNRGLLVCSSDKNLEDLPNDSVSAAEPPSSCTNLERFLQSTTPHVAAQYFSKTTMRGWRNCDVEYQPYFTLSDLWESFKEWSAYGAGVPLLLDGSYGVVQYYVPYLSGIQLYGEASTNTSPKLRQAGEDSDNDYYRDSSSDGSSDCEYEKGVKLSRAFCDHHLTSEVPLRIGSLSISDEHNNTFQEGFSSDDGEARNSQGRLLFEFLEQDIPYGHEPLADKILDLSRQYPGLNNLRSCDLLPISWVSVAWYPIYRIPMGSTLKDLDACFLTYHSLSTRMGGGGITPAPVLVHPNELDSVPRISLPVFGMASYKLKGSMWIQNGLDEVQMESSLLQAADNWLRLLQINHPDFQFFTSHSIYHR